MVTSAKANKRELSNIKNGKWTVRIYSPIKGKGFTTYFNVRTKLAAARLRKLTEI
jgi:hypothetical protein